MSERTIAEFVGIAEPIIEEYKNGILDANLKLKRSLEENLSDMNESETKILYSMIDNLKGEIAKMMEE